MKKYVWSVMSCLLLSLTMVSVAYGEDNGDEKAKPEAQITEQQKSGNEANKPEVQLTEQQKNELAKLHKDILEKKKEMIQKYVEFGVIPEEKGQMMISHFERHYEILEQNGFTLKMPHNHPKGDMPEKQE